MPQKPKRVNSHALGAFIRTQMAKKRISYAILVDNARRSGHTISRSWAGAIGQGKKEFPSMAALEAIAAGPGIPIEPLLDAASLPDLEDAAEVKQGRRVRRVRRLAPWPMPNPAGCQSS